MELVLSQQELETVEEFSRKVELNNAAILRYGAACQSRFARFSDQVVKLAGENTLEGAREGICSSMEQLQAFSLMPEEKIFSAPWKHQYEAAQIQIDRLVEILESYQNQLLKNSVLLERLYDTNRTYCKELSMYILAGQQKLARDEAAPEFRERFEQRLEDLEQTRSVGLQLAAQIQLLRDDHSAVMEKLHATLKCTIPLWKKQMQLAMEINANRQTLEAHRQAVIWSQEESEQNTKALEAAASRFTGEMSRGAVDANALQNANQALIETLDGVLEAQTAGRQRRSDAEKEITGLECRMRHMAENLG